jgi:hypothetical protein
MTEQRCKGCRRPLPPQTRGRFRVWCSEKCRKGQYAGTCADCGGPTNGYDGPGKAGERCAECRWLYQHEAAAWTRERLIMEAKRWRASTGEWPTSTQWASPPAMARSSLEYRQAIMEFRELTGPWPLAGSVGFVFGSWEAFMDACGGEAHGSVKGVRWGQRAREMRAVIDRLKAQQGSTELERPRAVTS